MEVPANFRNEKKKRDWRDLTISNWRTSFRHDFAQNRIYFYPIFYLLFFFSLMPLLPIHSPTISTIAIDSCFCFH